MLYQFTVEHFCHLVVAYVVSGYGVPPSLWQNSATTCKNVVVSGISYCMVDHPITLPVEPSNSIKGEQCVWQCSFEAFWVASASLVVVTVLKHQITPMYNVVHGTICMRFPDLLCFNTAFQCKQQAAFALCVTSLCFIPHLASVLQIIQAANDPPHCSPMTFIAKHKDGLPSHYVYCHVQTKSLTFNIHDLTRNIPHDKLTLISMTDWQIDTHKHDWQTKQVTGIEPSFRASH